jgi:hypothetical protein
MPEDAVEGLVGYPVAYANRAISQSILARKVVPIGEIRLSATARPEFTLRRLGKTETALLLGELQIRLGDRSDTALALLRGARENEHFRLRASIGEALIQLQTGDREGALAALEGIDLPADVPSETAVMLARGLFELSRPATAGTTEPAASAQHRLRRARSLFRSALDDPRCWLEAAHGYVLSSLALNEDDASVLALARKAYAAAPRNAELAISLAVLHERSGDNKVARRYWGEAAHNLRESPARSRILRELAVDERPAQK